MNASSFSYLVDQLRESCGVAACIRRSLDDYSNPVHQRVLRAKLAQADALSEARAGRLLAYIPFIDEGQFAALMAEPLVAYELCRIAEPDTPAYARLDGAC